MKNNEKRKWNCKCVYADATRRQRNESGCTKKASKLFPFMSTDVREPHSASSPIFLSYSQSFITRRARKQMNKLIKCG